MQKVISNLYKPFNCMSFPFYYLCEEFYKYFHKPQRFTLLETSECASRKWKMYRLFRQTLSTQMSPLPIFVPDCYCHILFRIFKFRITPTECDTHTVLNSHFQFFWSNCNQPNRGVFSGIFSYTYTIIHSKTA